MSKANDNIPADEMLLAEALAAAKAMGLSHTSGAAFRSATGQRMARSMGAASCCAIGAVALAGRVSEKEAVECAVDNESLRSVYLGNDMAGVWGFGREDRGESLGWAFRCAMTQEDQ